MYKRQNLRCEALVAGIFGEHLVVHDLDSRLSLLHDGRLGQGERRRAVCAFPGGSHVAGKRLAFLDEGRARLDVYKRQSQDRGGDERRHRRHDGEPLFDVQLPSPPRKAGGTALLRPALFSREGSRLSVRSLLLVGPGLVCTLAAAAANRIGAGSDAAEAVSYTHLDVYKRQDLFHWLHNCYLHGCSYPLLVLYVNRSSP